jgi:hypothetical protein
MKIPPLLLAAAFFATLPLRSGAAAVLLDDTFVDGNRDIQNLPNSAALYHGESAGHQSLVVESQTLNLEFHSTANQLGQFVGYFTNSGVTTLQVGDKLSFQFTLSSSAINPDGNSLRIGLFDSGGNRVTADGGISEEAFNGSTGYSFWSSLGTVNGGFRQRTGTNNTLWNSTTNANLGSQNLAGLDYAAGTTYTLTFAVERTSPTEMVVTFTDGNGKSYSRTDNEGIFTGFDTFSVFAGNGTVNDITFTFDDILITYTPVPEPGSASMLTGVTVAFLFIRRKMMR